MPQWEDRPLVGRATELARLTEHVERARAGRPSAVLLAGDAGVGKSRLLGAVGEVAREQGLRVLTGHCLDLGDVGLPYLPFVDLLRPLRDELATAHPAVVPLLGTPDAAPAEGGRLPLFEGVAALLGELSAAQPLLVVLEDLHWADRSSRDLLRYLLTRLVAEPVLVVASYRSDDLHRRHPLRPLLGELVRLPGVERLDLPPLPDGELADLVRAAAAADGGVAERLVADVVARAEGNAFYAEELLAAGSRGGELPWALSEVLLARVEELGPAAQQVLRVAAVVGRRVRHDLLTAVAGLPEADLDAALAEAVHRHVLVVDPDGRLRFRHALLREAVLADLLPGERTRVHAAVAVRLRTEGAGGTGTAAELAHHARESNDLPGAFTAALTAADEATAVGAPAEALLQLEAALTLWPAVPDRHAGVPDGEVGLLLRAAAAARAAGELHRGIALLRSARDLAPTDPYLAGRVQYTLAQALVRVDDLAGAGAASAAALELVPAQPLTADRVWATATRARTAWSSDGDAEVARAAALEALAGAEQLGLESAWSDTMISLARMTGEGDPAARTADLVEALERARRAGDLDVELRAAFNLATIAYESGDLAAAVAHAGPALSRAAALGVGWSFYAAELRYLQVLAQLHGGDWDAALAGAGELARVPDTAAHVRVAGLHVAIARGADVRQQVDQAWAMGDRLGLAALVLTAGSAGIELAGWREDATAAVAAAERSIRRLREIWPLDFLVAVRLAAVALGPVADAAAAARVAGDEETARRWTAAGDRVVAPAREAQALFAEHLGEVDREGRAWALRLDAEVSRLHGRDDATAWAAVGAAFGPQHVWEQARCRWREGAALLAAGERERAAECLRAAHEVAVALGAAPLRTRLEALARRGRLDLGSAVARPADPAAVFTPREAEVLGRVAAGLTNRQIGAELFISEKTVSVHLSRVLAKLGVSGRTEAVAVAAQRGLLT